VKCQLTFRRDGIVTCYRGATAASLKRGRAEYGRGYWVARATMEASVDAAADPVRQAQQEERRQRFIDAHVEPVESQQVEDQELLAFERVMARHDQACRDERMQLWLAFSDTALDG